jgi:hypothetical protein
MVADLKSVLSMVTVMANQTATTERLAVNWDD